MNLSNLAKTAAILNQETLDLNKIIENFEQSLIQASPGIEVWTSTILEPQSKKDCITKLFFFSGWVLGFCKVKHNWRLAVKPMSMSASTDSPPPFEKWIDSRRKDEQSNRHLPVPLLTASRVIRSAALSQFDALVTELETTIQKCICDVQEAKSKVQVVLTKIESE